jgi:hypothetical protein
MVRDKRRILSVTQIEYTTNALWLKSAKGMKQWLIPSAEGSVANVNVQERIQQTKHLQQPQYDGNDHNGVQDPLQRGLHRDVAIHKP